MTDGAEGRWRGNEKSLNSQNSNSLALRPQRYIHIPSFLILPPRSISSCFFIFEAGKILQMLIGILLYPRVILDRIRVTPSRPSSAASRRQSSTVNLEESETPRSRESFDDFARTLSGIDPMEGPSWLFEEESSAQTTTKTRDEKRKENSLKARFSSASRRLSVETEEEQPSEVVPSEQEQPPEPPLQPPPPAEEEPRRRGSRAAAAAARSSLKEPTLNSKLRQGDPSSTSVYEDFVPGTKRKSSSEPKSSKSAKSSDASKSKSKRKNSNDKDEKNTK